MTTLPLHVRDLITSRVSSVEKLVIIVELGKRPERRMQLDALQTALPFPAQELGPTVRELEAAAIVVRDGEAVALVSADPALEDLLRCYAADPIATVNELSKISLKRIRNMTIAFSDSLEPRKRRR